jgi:ADP-dependent NAD(P)H-hydrate dehydratase / NAD(P)H-hydrate epimerase
MGADTMKIVTSEQMRNIDRRATEQFGIPSIILMENAALALLEAILDRFPDAERVALFCGTGQNGGDAFALARHLENHHIVPAIFLAGSRTAIEGDALTNLIACERMGIPIYSIDDGESVNEALAQASGYDLLVDGLFGTGLNRPLEGIYADIVNGIASLRLPVVAIDVPSGISGSTPAVSEPVVAADLTVTFAAPKIAHVFEPAADFCGEIVVADISIPRAALEAENVSLSILSPDEIAALFPPRTADSHKGTYGHLAIIGGSEGRSGAAVLAVRGALRSGSGLVTVATDAETARIVDSFSAESMSFAFDRDRGRDRLLELAGRMDALVAGPGLPDDADAYRFVEWLVASVDRPLVLDASGLNAFQAKIETLNPRGLPRVITPHPGELARLTGKEKSSLAADRLAAAREAAVASRCVVVLKGHKTVVAEPEGRIAVNPTGNPGMATGGMGDVLAGMIGSLLGQGFDPWEASCAAVFLHGRAADLLASERSQTGLTALEVADAIPRALESLRSR